MFLPITDLKQRYFFEGEDGALGKNIRIFANNKDLSGNTSFDFGYTVGVRVYNANTESIKHSVWDVAPFTYQEYVKSDRTKGIGKIFDLEYSADK